MIRRFNYTKRRKIDRQELVVRVTQGRPPTLDFNISDNELKHYPDHGRVYVEAYKGPKVQRLDCGTVDALSGGFIRRPLDAFRSEELPRFRVKIVDEQRDKRPILGWAHQIPPEVKGEDGEFRRSILPVEPRDLGHEVWKLFFENDEDPVLLVNSKILESRDIVSIVQRDPEFAALVFPECLRSILNHKFLNEEPMDEEDDWYQFACNLGVSIDPETDDREERSKWIDRAVSSFAARIGVVKSYKDHKEGRKK